MAFKLDEVNDVNFKLSIKGTVSDPTQTVPVVRFVVTEDTSGVSWMFPLESREEGLFGTKMPFKSTIFNEGTGYTGKVEVIVGGRYFNPTSVDVVFERELEVEASPIMSEMADDSIEGAIEGTRDELDEFSSVIKPEPKQMRIKGKKIPVDLDKFKEAIFTEKQEKPETTRQLPAPKKPVDAKTERYKNKLKSLIAEAVSEMDK